MEQETRTLYERISAQSSLGRLILVAKKILGDEVTLVLGRPGLPNLEKHLHLGDAVLFETPDSGVFEVRIMQIGPQLTNTDVLITRISPQPGMAAGFVEQDISNAPFTKNELQQIRASMARIRDAMKARTDVPPEKLDLILRKLDYMQNAAERFGRKDWIIFAMGTLTSIIVDAQLTSDAAKALFQIANEAFSWLFDGNVRLLP